MLVMDVGTQSSWNIISIFGEIQTPDGRRARGREAGGQPADVVDPSRGHVQVALHAEPRGGGRRRCCRRRLGRRRRLLRRSARRRRRNVQSRGAVRSVAGSEFCARFLFNFQYTSPFSSTAAIIPFHSTDTLGRKKYRNICYFDSIISTNYIYELQIG